MREIPGAGLRRRASRPLAAADPVVTLFTVRRLLLWLIAILVLLQAPAIARDRPGTPNRPEARSCNPQDPMLQPWLCFTFFNTAGSDKVHFEIEMNGVLLDLRDSRQAQCWVGAIPARSPPPADQFGCALNNSGAGIEGNQELGVGVPNLQFDTRYCFRVRTRRADDQVVSEQWSAQVCEQTRAKPSLPGKPVVNVQFFPSKLQVYVPPTAFGGMTLSVATTRPPTTWSPSDPYTYELHTNEDRVQIEACAENISGRQCAEVVVSAKQATVLSDVSNLAPPPPTGVLHVTGKAVGDPLPPPGPSGPSAFVGVWDTHTGQNGHFRVTFSESNGVLVGKFEDLNGNAQYNGTLTQKPGTQVRADFFYTYEQPVTKGSGSGEFIIMSDSKLMGKIVTNDNPPLKTGWWGTRIGAPPGPDVK
jgi:hypothetical protein